MVNAISPKQAKANKQSSIPGVVIEAFNQLISEKINIYGHATIVQDTAIEKILELDPSLTKEKLVDKKWLDIEEIYRNQGWEVTYFHPSWDENYTPYFLFKESK